jgi:hypothetical protein
MNAYLHRGTGIVTDPNRLWHKGFVYPCAAARLNAHNLVGGYSIKVRVCGYRLNYLIIVRSGDERGKSGYSRGVRRDLQMAPLIIKAAHVQPKRQKRAKNEKKDGKKDNCDALFRLDRTFSSACLSHISSLHDSLCHQSPRGAWYYVAAERKQRKRVR